MKLRLLTLNLGLITAIAAGGCATADTNKSADEVIAQAEQQLAAAKKMNAEWKLIDKATGGSSKDLSKLLDAAKKAKASGNEAEAIRIANRVLEASMLGQQQAKDQASAMPSYPN